MALIGHPLAGIRARRELLGIPASKMAHEIGIEPQAYYRYERGERQMYLARALRVAAILDCKVEQLSQPPSIEEQLAVLHAHQAAEAARLLEASKPVDPAAAFEAAQRAAGLLPVRDNMGGPIVGWQEAPKPAPAPTTTDDCVVSAPPTSVEAPPAPVHDLSGLEDLLAELEATQPQPVDPEAHARLMEEVDEIEAAQTDEHGDDE